MSFSQKQLRTPPTDCAVVYAWAWNDVITKESIDRDLDAFVRAGVKAIYVLPLPKDFRPEVIRTFLHPEYLTPEFWSLMEYALRRAKDLGMGLWLYDEGGWPSGGACKNTLREHPEVAVRKLKTREITLTAGERYTPSPDAIALFDGKTRLPDDFCAARDMTLTEYYTERFTSNASIVDLTRADATEAFIENTYVPYTEHFGDRFGKDIPIFFTDEPALVRNHLPEGFCDAFLERFGYDLRDYLYVIEDYGAAIETEEERQARMDYGRLAGELLRKNTFLPLRDYCRSKGIRYGGHLNNDSIAYGGMWCGGFGLVECLRLFDVPGIDVIWEQIRYPYGGRAPLDDETQGFGFFPRLASSAARQEGKAQTLSESLAIYGNALTPDEIRFVVNYQIMRGINTFNFMSTSSSEERCLSLMGGSPFNRANPDFYQREQIHETTARLCYLARLGKTEGDTALFHPAADFWAGPDAVKAANESFCQAGTVLEDKNSPFDIIDEYGVADATVTPDGLLLGDACYRHIIVPQNRYMSEETRKKLAPFIGEGKPLYTPKNDKIRVMTRLLDGARLWFFFNEGIDTVTETFDIRGEQKLYRIDVRTGNMYTENEACATLVCGDIAVYLVTDEVYDTVSDEVADTATVTDFAIVGYDRYTVDHRGVSTAYHVGEPTVDESFSGSIHYVTRYALPFAPKAGERYRLSLADTSVSASVLVNGSKVCDMGLTPMAAEIDGAQLPQNGELCVIVSNTASNETVAKREFVANYFPKAEIGPYILRYADKLPIFELRRPPLHFGGTLTVEKMKG